MRWLPAEVSPCLGAAEALIARIASCPIAEFAGDLISRNDQRRLPRHAEALCKGAGDEADLNPINRCADVARSAGGAIECERIELRKIVAVYQRPMHILASDDPDDATRAAIVGKAAEYAAVCCVDHRRMDHDAIYAGRGQNAFRLWDHPGKGGQRVERRFLGCNRLLRCAKQPAAAGIDET